MLVENNDQGADISSVSDNSVLHKAEEVKDEFSLSNGDGTVSGNGRFFAKDVLYQGEDAAPIAPVVKEAEMVTEKAAPIAPIAPKARIGEGTLLDAIDDGTEYVPPKQEAATEITAPVKTRSDRFRVKKQGLAMRAPT